MDELSLNKISREFFEMTMLLHTNIIKPDEFMKSLSMPPSHVKVVFYLAQNGPSSVSNIAKDLCISKPNMTPVIDKLLEAGYVKRYEHPNDRRVLIIEITEKAQEIFRLKREFAVSLLKEKLSHLEDADINTLGTAVSDLIRIFCKLSSN